jgi:hypothetical protein
MRHVLTNGATVLPTHRWSIVKPADGHEWITSDHPAMRLNFNKPDDYNFLGGWNQQRADIIMPLSPRHLLWTEVGAKSPSRLVFSTQQTELIQRFLAERAHRWIFAHSRLDSVRMTRPRVVDLDAFRAEQQMWSGWHEGQREAELEINGGALT